MDDKQNVGGRDRLVRFLLAAGLSIVSIRWLRNGKRLRGLVAGVGALGFGFNATTGYCGANDALGIDTTGESEEVEIDFEETDTEGTETAASTKRTASSLHCAACGEPIVPGQSRGPNSDDEIVHDECA